CTVGGVVVAVFITKERTGADGNVPVTACAARERVCTDGRVLHAISSRSKGAVADGGFIVAGYGVITKECAANTGAAFATNGSRSRRKLWPSDDKCERDEM